MFSVRADGAQLRCNSTVRLAWLGVSAGNLAAHQSRHDALGIPRRQRGAVMECQVFWLQRFEVVAVDIYNQTTNETSQALSSSASDIHHTGGVINPSQAMAVRRLTPKECERLQGFPDNHTLIPWRGKPAEQCPDGPRYKALGNSMAVPCMAWIGSRIAAQDSEPLRYLSVCSGIEAASMAWEPLGWQPAAFAEVEKFPSAVLAHHWPQVPNMGDMNNHEQWDLPAIDVLVGGTPCQSFSVAGLRKGLRDPRGGLMLTFLEIAQRRRPRWIVWENVPGVLSSHGGRDFGAFLGALGALGYGWAYRVLDAQWFGVAQRRRRVFVVANLGDGAAAAKVLFESESVRRNPAPSREAGERTAATLSGGAGKRSGGIGYDNRLDSARMETIWRRAAMATP
jgi:site-specific DNA-cytosine methylase